MPNRSIRDDMQRAPIMTRPMPAPVAPAPVARPQPVMQPISRMPQSSPMIMNPALPAPGVGQGTGTLSPALMGAATAPAAGGISAPAPGGSAFGGQVGNVGGSMGNVGAPAPAPAPVLAPSQPSPAARPAPVQAIGNPAIRQGGVIGQPMIGAQPRPVAAPMPMQGATGPGTAAPGPAPMPGIGRPPVMQR